ncbi:hypothetical protein Nmel_003808 [Mimus melanotis]
MKKLLMSNLNLPCHSLSLCGGCREKRLSTPSSTALLCTLSSTSMSLKRGLRTGNSMRSVASPVWSTGEKTLQGRGLLVGVAPDHPFL